jgi:hypothetical protein
MYTWEQIAGVIRHLLTAGGGILVALGMADEAFIDTFVQQALGVVMMLGPVVWSWLRKTKTSIVTQASDIVHIATTDQIKAGVSPTNVVVTPRNPVVPE